MPATITTEAIAILRAVVAEPNDSLRGREESSLVSSGRDVTNVKVSFDGRLVGGRAQELCPPLGVRTLLLLPVVRFVRVVVGGCVVALRAGPPRRCDFFHATPLVSNYGIACERVNCKKIMAWWVSWFVLHLSWFAFPRP
jgi:hypothetical protein